MGISGAADGFAGSDPRGALENSPWKWAVGILEAANTGSHFIKKGTHSLQNDAVIWNLVFPLRGKLTPSSVPSQSPSADITRLINPGCCSHGINTIKNKYNTIKNKYNFTQRRGSLDYLSVPSCPAFPAVISALLCFDFLILTPQMLLPDIALMVLPLLPEEISLTPAQTLKIMQILFSLLLNSI